MGNAFFHINVKPDKIRANEKIKMERERGRERGGREVG